MLRRFQPQWSTLIEALNPDIRVRPSDLAPHQSHRCVIKRTDNDLVESESSPKMGKGAKGF
jgi:hypothetical protein